MVEIQETSPKEYDSMTCRLLDGEWEDELYRVVTGFEIMGLYHDLLWLTIKAKGSWWFSLHMDTELMGESHWGEYARIPKFIYQTGDPIVIRPFFINKPHKIRVFAFGYGKKVEVIGRFANQSDDLPRPEGPRPYDCALTWEPERKDS